MPFIILYLTSPTEEEANTVVNHLLQQRLIAGANTFLANSAYWWLGKRTQSPEYISIMQSRPQHWEAIQAAIKKLHSYEVPCIIKMPATANADYEAWVYEETAISI